VKPFAAGFVARGAGKGVGGDRASRAGTARGDAVTADDRLADYHRKRDFDRTSEPRGEAAPSGDAARFVIQKHRARRLHYDLRLEVGGVLKSWAVPKGPSLDPRDKRLAVAVEDHPLEYGGFEGVIPEGEYGAGTVLIWDTGTYRNITNKGGRDVPADEAIEAGHLDVWLEGEKLAGGFALIRTKRHDGRDWLLVKMKDRAADPGRDPVDEEPDSIVSGRSLERIAEEGGT
jgi:DNA ligase D-like protein (predicted 3'-phosphoesterase)